MCGRFILYTSEEQREIRRIIDEVNEKHHVRLKQGDIYPSQIAPVYKNEMELDVMVWGYKTHYSKSLLINARSETVMEKKTFRGDFMERRCLIPAAGFYEWDKFKEKYIFETDRPLLYLGGFYRSSPSGNHFVIMTKPALEPVVSIHKRMPVLISPNKAEAYLADPDAAITLLTDDSLSLKRRACSGQLSMLEPY